LTSDIASDILDAVDFGVQGGKMGYLSKVQVIQRGEKNRQYYLICPAPLAQALELEKGETIEWVIESKKEFTIRRIDVASRSGKRASDER
jgi:hypothetical protein